MPSLSTLARGIPRVLRDRGDDYFRRGRVYITHVDDFSVRAQVEGSERYAVHVTWDDDGVTDADCTCPAADNESSVCKHIWAAILAAHASANGTTAPQRPTLASLTTPVWRLQLARVRQRMEQQSQVPILPPRVPWPADRRIAYVIDLAETHVSTRGGLVLDLMTERLERDGTWSAPKKSNFPRHQWLAVPDGADRLAVQMLFGTSDPWGFYASGNATRFVLAPDHYETILRTICQTGRCHVRRHQDDDDVTPPVSWDNGAPWEFRLRITHSADGKSLDVAGHLSRDADDMPLSEPLILLRTGLLIARGRVSRLADQGAFELLATLRAEPTITVPAADAWTLIEDLYRLPHPPHLDLPDDLRVEEISTPPLPTLKVTQAPRAASGPDRLIGDLTFDYAGTLVIPTQHGDTLFDAAARRVLRRDPAAEFAAAQLLQQSGFRLEFDLASRRQYPMIPFAKFPRAVRELVSAGWHVEADGKLYRPPGDTAVTVSSGIDWFDLDARVTFGTASAPLPRLLAAIKKGESTITLDDGTVGILPEEWLQKYAPLTGFGEEQPDGRLRFRSTQAAFLDALLASSPQATWDESFDHLRTRLRDFGGIRPADAPPGFTGQLRPYQQDGLGWLHFLRDFSFGGCLADDMGLGKTIQVLALLQSRKGQGPSLVVAPRSLIFNWIEEAKRFTPDLKVLDHSAASRKRSGATINDHDLVLTTYGTLRRDAAFLKDVRFDYAILDEAQAVKNASTASAKAVRLLNANHRLALSGTPIENHLGELWSLLDFLNPGMLGTATAFKQWSGGNTGAAPESRAALAQAIRPFVLRRTKQQVAKDLPDRTEQTIHCELDKDQRKLYDELRDHYRKSLLGRIDDAGMGKAKIEILEGLLRLRQAACHPALIDQKYAGASSAKLDALLAHLDEILEENHKALIFSQFTSLLALVREQLDARKIPYEYLDGQTRDRQARVDHFQSDPDCRLFLISLKAGGVGLNLTAADYVFLLDPWWNPAAEAQAIDRTHRIGQTRSVFAYRLIAKDTVEEKVLELQQSKRDLAEAIITADNALLSKLTRDDLQHLLS